MNARRVGRHLFSFVRWIGCIPVALTAGYVVLRVTVDVGAYVGPVAVPLTILATYLVVAVARLMAPSRKRTAGGLLWVTIALGIVSDCVQRFDMMPLPRRFTPWSQEFFTDFFTYGFALMGSTVALVQPVRVRAKRAAATPPSWLRWMTAFPLAIAAAALAKAYVNLVTDRAGFGDTYSGDIEGRFLTATLFVLVAAAVVPARKMLVTSLLAACFAVYGAFAIASGLAAVHAIAQFPNSETAISPSNDTTAALAFAEGLAEFAAAFFALAAVRRAHGIERVSALLPAVP